MEKNDRILDKGEISVVVKAGESIQAVQLDYKTVLDGAEKRAAYLTYEWECGRKKDIRHCIICTSQGF